MGSYKRYYEAIFERCAISDRGALLKLLGRMRAQRNAKKMEPQLLQKIEASIKQVGLRQQQRPKVTLNPDLPFAEYAQALRTAIADNQVVIVCGETGSGKSTQLPQLCIEMGLADRGKVGHTQPRRIAARTLAARISSELRTEPGQAVGYKVRFNDTTQANSYVKLMTDGILLAEIQHDRWLNEYQTLIIDEAHERSLNIDLLLGYIKTLLARRPDLKLLITSATIDAERFSRYFDEAPLVTVSGRTYPVEIRYRPLDPEQGRDRDLAQQVSDALTELFAESPQDTLVFLAGERQIRELAERLRKQFHQFQVMPLYSRLSNEQQQRIFQSGGACKIVLTTNVAETSLTVPGIRYVIDSGQARMSRYSWRSKVQRLPIEKISQASANQRAGRCGRVAAGTCIRLYDEQDFLERAEFTEPEILRTNLASVILQMDSLRIGNIRDFDFIETPDNRLVSDGYRLLHELQAVDTEDRITPLGKKIGRFSIDPRLARMLLRAAELGCLAEMLVVAAALSVQDPRDQSTENRQAAREKYRLWQDKKSDFSSWVNLWREIHQQRERLGRNGFNKWCRSQYLSAMRVREWQDIYRQVHAQLDAQGLKLNREEGDRELLHRAILSGIPSHIAHLDQEDQYRATRGRQLAIFPASVLARQKPKWFMAFALMETSRLYALEVGSINPQWVMADLAHLHQYEYYEPHWQEKQRRVAAYRNTRLYGLLIEGGRRVNYASIDPKVAREIFIREGLVNGRFATRVAFIKDNQKLIDGYRDQESRERRRDLLIGEEQIVDFYLQRIPEDVVDGVYFERWVKTLDVTAIRQLTLFDQDVLQTEHQQNRDDFPQTLQVRQQQLRLSYVFEPSDEADGVTVWIPLELLNQFDEGDFDYLVPGLLGEKIAALIRALPKTLRKNFIPVPEYAQACIEAVDRSRPFYQQLSLQLLRMTGVAIAESDWRPMQIDAHLQMRFCLEEQGVAVASSRSLQQLQQEYAGLASERFEEQVEHDHTHSRSGLTAWDFAKLPQQVTLQRGGSRLQAYPALVDYEDSVAIELFDNAPDAAFYHAAGVVRLLAFAQRDKLKYLRKNLPGIDQSALMYIGLGSRDELVEDVIMAAIEEAFAEHESVRTEADFKELIMTQQDSLISVAQQSARLLQRILSEYREVNARLQQSLLPAAHQADCEQQLEYLVYPGFVRATAARYRKRMPVYLQALAKRVDKSAPGEVHKLDSRLSSIRALWGRYLELLDTDVDQQALETIRWKLEELRINYFAQPMKTPEPVSEKRIQNMFAELVE